VPAVGFDRRVHAALFEAVSVAAGWLASSTDRLRSRRATAPPFASARYMRVFRHTTGEKRPQPGQLKIIPRTVVVGRVIRRHRILVQHVRVTGTKRTSYAVPARQPS
jgi:hypothetical protein